MEHFEDTIAAEEISGRWTEDERTRNRNAYALPDAKVVAALYRRCGLAACVSRWGHLYSSRAIFDFATGVKKPVGDGWRSGKRSASMSGTHNMCAV
jgi:hypothetical protein